jgi:hypothetical protein
MTFVMPQDHYMENAMLLALTPDPFDGRGEQDSVGCRPICEGQAKA